MASATFFFFQNLLKKCNQIRFKAKNINNYYERTYLI